MALITSDQRDELFDTFEKDAFHLELKDEYRSPIEDDPAAKWRAGLPDDHAWLQPWLGRMREATASGKTVRRVRVITEPISEYIRWENSLTPLNLEAGEDIRWLPRHQLPDGIAFPVDNNDWWLFDDRLLAVGHFHDDGRVKGSELITDPDRVAECAKVRDLLWSIAVPHNSYTPR
jgi:hypothetical protein